MQTKLRWKKRFLSNVYNIYSNGQQIGNLNEKTFSQTANGELNGKKYAFKTKGFFKQHTDIIDLGEHKVIGEIMYNSWMTRATISIGNEKIYWKYDNLWNTRWRIYNSGGITIQYSGSSTSGQINANTDDVVILLSGLFVTNYYWQSSIAVLIAIFVPLWLTVFG